MGRMDLLRFRSAHFGVRSANWLTGHGRGALAECRVNFYISIAGKAIGRNTENGCREICNDFPAASREAAEFVSPARKRRVARVGNQSRLLADDTVS